MILSKSSISIKFLVNLPAHPFENIQGIPELLGINSETVICRLDSPYIWGIETAKRSFSGTIGATCSLLTGTLTILSIKVVFHRMDDVMFLHAIMIDEIYYIICKRGYPCVFHPTRL